MNIRIKARIARIIESEIEDIGKKLERDDDSYSDFKHAYPVDTQ